MRLFALRHGLIDGAGRAPCRGWGCAADGRANNAIGVIRRGPAQSADNRDAVIRPTLRFDRWFRAGALP
ncbi:hypothetical protein, partial [Klebsiella pneumoniae]|uniref:hypothetical protein n=1 Tax=Klebsiella pneumoniae TaxID=573 RepID=UPI001D0E6B38